MDLAELDYELPPELIAQHPAERRDASRLLVYDRATGAVRHRTFAELPDELAGELVVVNDTKVVPARIPIASPRGEVLLLERLEDGTWEALARPTRRLRPGRRYGQVELLEHLGEGRWRLRLEGEPAGETPLPPYITEPLDDAARYQTVYAREPGSAAAPTAGLHFTPRLLEELQVKGVKLAYVTLHVGLDTFAPVTEDNPEEHKIHSEWCELSQETADLINQPKKSGGRVIAVGTTSVRTLESAGNVNGELGIVTDSHLPNKDSQVSPFIGPTALFILPGYEF